MRTPLNAACVFRTHWMKPLVAVPPLGISVYCADGENLRPARTAFVAAASIWVDADACPNVIKEILFRAAERTGVAVTLVANQPLQIPRIPSLRAVQVSAGFDVADSEIVKRVSTGDLVVTADIPLAAEVIAKGGEALNPRGERYSPDTIRGVLAMRDFMDTMRSSGNVGGGPPPLSQANRNAFAGQLDTWLARRAAAARGT